MAALFLMLDEELTNLRPGRARGTKFGLFGTRQYTPKDILFWLQLYSLFHDRLYVPANMLLDANTRTADFFRILATANDPAILSVHSPLRVLWDTSRFEARTFKELLRELERDPLYITARDPRSATDIANFADEHFAGRIDEVSMAGNADHKESYHQLRNECFRRERNAAGIAHERLADALERINRQGYDRGYGRNFYYTIFGYAESDTQKALARKFAPAVSKVMDLRDEFLTCVDYVSHGLKAKFASDGLREPIDVLMPPDFLEFMVPPESVAPVRRPARTTVRATEREMRSIMPEALMAMTTEQFAVLRDSPEYHNFRASVDEFTSCQATNMSTTVLDDLEDRVIFQTTEYLSVITRTLGTKRTGRDVGFWFADVVASRYRLLVDVVGAVFPGVSPELVNACLEVSARPAMHRFVHRLAPNDRLTLHAIKPTPDIEIFAPMRSTHARE